MLLGGARIDLSGFNVFEVRVLFLMVGLLLVVIFELKVVLRKLVWVLFEFFRVGVIY